MFCGYGGCNTSRTTFKLTSQIASLPFKEKELEGIHHHAGETFCANRRSTKSVLYTCEDAIATFLPKLVSFKETVCDGFCITLDDGLRRLEMHWLPSTQT